MSIPNMWKIACAVFVLCAATTIASPAQTFTSLFSFDGSDGIGPYSQSFIQGTNGTLYGTTWEGGDLTCNAPYGCGTIFEIGPKGLRTLHAFESSDGALPFSGLVQATDRNFYGTTLEGGDLTCNSPYGCGTVFKITPGGTLTTLHNFESVDGLYPDQSLIQGFDGDLYGTTEAGGSNGGYGTVFKITLEGKLTSLHSFNNLDGNGPSGLLQVAGGAFYGMNNAGGSSSNCLGGCGTIFKISAGGTLRTLHNFNSNDGSHPGDPFVQASDGNFYGTTEGGGLPSCPGDGGIGCGTLFQFTPGGVLTTLHTFCSQLDCADGNFPGSPLIQATDGNLYGTTYEGGNDSSCDHPYGCGTVFQITLGGILTTLRAFDMSDGESAVGGLFQATNGSLYGATREGGKHGDGTVFSVDMGLGPFVTFIRAAGKVGQTGGILGQGFTGTTSVSLNGIPANFTVVSDTYIRATVPAGATTGYVTVTTPSGTLTSNVPFHVIP